MIFTEALVILFLGLVFGSFSTALVYRVPREMNWVSKRSSCPSCHNVLTVVDLVPVFSWLCSGGKCRHCAVAVPIRYPLTEVAAVVLCFGIYFALGFNAESLFVLAAIPFLLSLLVIDLDRYILPNELVFIALVIGLFRLLYFSISGSYSYAHELLIPYGIGAVVYPLVSWGMGVLIGKILKRDALGFGDVKFFLVAGIWLGMPLFSHFLILSGLLGVITAFFFKVLRKKDIFPFGPALIMSLYFLLLWQGRILV